MGDTDVDVALYGATGYTGRLVAHELDRAGASFVLAGRSRERLEELAAELKTDPEVVPVPLDDGAGLRDLASRAGAMASAAGPFMELGPPILEACLATGTHCVDTTGEQGYMRWCHARDARVRDAGITVVNAMGFDVIPTDVAAVAAAEGLDAVDRVDIGFNTTSRMSDGTKRTMAASTGGGCVYEEGAFRAAVPGRWTRRFPVPDDLPVDLGVFIPWGDVATAPRSTGASTVRTFFLLPDGRAKAIHRTWPLQWATGKLAKLPGVPRILRWFAPDDRGGPSAEDRARAVFTAVAEAHAPDGTVRRSLVTGRDPYGLTGAGTARGALALAGDHPASPGVLTPTEAFGVEGLTSMLSDFDLEVTAPWEP